MFDECQGDRTSLLYQRILKQFCVKAWQTVKEKACADWYYNNIINRRDIIK